MIGFFIHGFYVEMSSFHQFLSLIVKVNEFFYGIVLYHACVHGIRFFFDSNLDKSREFHGFHLQHLLSGVQ